MSKIVTEEKKREIREFYLRKPISLVKMSEIFGYCGITIRRILGPDIKLYEKNRIFNPELNEDFFSAIDDESKAYFLGLIISDGNVYDPNDSGHRTTHGGSKWVSISLQENDSYILNSFREKIGLTSKVASDGRGTSYVSVRSNKMAEDLEKYGIVQRKSFITEFPRNVPEELYRHVIRGIIDGDGSVDAYEKYTPKDNRNRFKHRISCCGTHRLMCEMVEIIKENVKLEFLPKVYDYKNRVLSEFKVSNIHDMYALGKWMYEGSTIYMKRKQGAFEEFVKHYDLEPVRLHNFQC